MSDEKSPEDHPPLTDADRAFLRALADIPEDRTTWLVYADWLEDRGDPRASFLRLVVARSLLPVGDPAVAETDARLAQLKAELDPRWLAAFDPARVVVGCPLMVDHPGACGRVWTELAPTDAPDGRICWDCRRPVFYAHTAEEAEQIGSLGEVVALSTRVPPELNPFPPVPPSLNDDSGEFVLDLGPALPTGPVTAPPLEPPRPWWRFW